MVKGRVAQAIALAVVLSALAGCSTTAAAHPSADPRPVPTHRQTPTPVKVDPALVYADKQLASMTLPQKVGSLLMLHRPGTDAAALQAFVVQYGLGGLILMGDNIPGSEQELAAETAAISPDKSLPVLLGTDEEGGDVQRLPWDPAAGADTLKDEAPDATTAAFAQRGALLKQAGVNMNFGVIADVTSDPNSFIYDRVLGTDAAAASARVSAAVAAERGSVLSTIKHFPGHGETEADSHLTIPTTAISYDQWTQRDEPSFQAGVDAGVQAVMVGHLVYSAVDAQPASLSKPWHDILKQKLRFNGITITDDLRMLQDSGLPQYQNPSENAIQALAAGNTMLLFVTGGDQSEDGIDPGGLIADICAAVQSGRISEQQIDQDARMLLVARHRLATGNTSGAWVSP